MSGDWIKMRADLQSHPKIVRMASALKADKLRVIGALHAVWCLFDTHSEDGSLDGYTTKTLDTHICWPGFSDAMVGIKWLVPTNVDSLSLPEFDEHNGQSAKRRALESKRKRDERILSALDADKSQTREEKRREEKNLKKKKDISSAPPEFEEAWDAYPARPGANKSATLKAWMARINAGAQPQDMVDGTRRYANFVRVMKTDPQFVKQPATFFGPDKHYASSWEATAKRSIHDLSGMDYTQPAGDDGIPNA